MIKAIAATLVLAASALGLAGCSSTPDKPSDATPGAVYNKPIAQVQQAAVSALTANGFEIQKQDATYVEGMRPHKMGAFVGSGGETAGVWLKALSDSQTSVQVDTAKSFVGMAGQKSWNTEILAAMDQSLGQHR